MAEDLGIVERSGNCRDPEVPSWNATADSLVAELRFGGDGEWFSGHFPDFPVLPGVAQLFFLRRFARRVFPDFPDAASYRRVKFRRLVRPDETVLLEVKRIGAGSFSFQMSVDGEVSSSGIVEDLGE